MCMIFPCINKDNIIEIYDKPIKSNINKFICEDDERNLVDVTTNLNNLFF